MDFFKTFFRGDRTVWVIYGFLCLVSLLAVFSASSTLASKYSSYTAPIISHAKFLIGGFFLILLIHNLPVKYLKFGVFLLPLSLVLLIISSFWGVSANNASRWISIMGVTFQPSELVKISMILFTALMLSLRKKISEKIVFRTIVILLFFSSGIILKDNFSTSFLLFVIVFTMMFIGQISIVRISKVIFSLIGVGALALLLIIYVPAIKEHLPKRFSTWTSRIENFNNKEKELDKNGDDYQVLHAKYAIAGGGVIGRMPGQGKQREFLPQAYSDFIYAIIIEEYGLFGGFFVLFLYIALFVKVGMIASKCKDTLFPKYLVMGCGLIITIQALANMAVAVNLIPVTGQPLPLISRGGTSILITSLYIGIILSISRFASNTENVYLQPEEAGEEDLEKEGVVSIKIE